MHSSALLVLLQSSAKRKGYIIKWFFIGSHSLLSGSENKWSLSLKSLEYLTEKYSSWWFAMTSIGGYLHTVKLSQYHRIMEWLGFEGTSEITSFNPLPQAGLPAARTSTNPSMKDFLFMFLRIMFTQCYLAFLPIKVKKKRFLFYRNIICSL